MHRLLALATISILGGVAADAKADNTKQARPGWDAAARVGSNPGSTSARINEVAKDALQVTESSQATPGPSPERLQAANRVAKLLPPIGSGESGAKVTQYEINIDPPPDAPYVARATISFMGDRPVTLYVLKKPIVQPGAPDQDGAKAATNMLMDIVGLPTGESARTSSAGGNPTIACMAKPMAKDGKGICSVSLPGIPILLTGTYLRQNDKDQAFDRETNNRLVAVFNRLRR